MTTRFPRWLGFFGACLCALPATAALELWVAPDGSDENTGSRERPFASVSAAQRHARDLRRLRDPSIVDGVRITLTDGTYVLERPLEFRPEDSGTPEHPTVITAALDTQPVLSGGIAISGWRRPEGVIPGLPENAQPHVWVAEVPQVAGRPLEFRQLWVDNTKAIRARSPNGQQMHRLAGWDRSSETAVVDAGLFAHLQKPSEVEMVVQQQWEIAVLRIRDWTTDGTQVRVGFRSPESRLEFEHPWPQPILPPEGGGAFFLTNAIQLLDEPGEWHLDRAGGRIFYWPRDGEDMQRVQIVVPVLESLVNVEGSADRPVKHIAFSGIAFSHTTWLRPSHSGHVPLQAGMYLTEAYKLRPKGTADWRSLDNQAWIGRPPAAARVAYAENVAFLGCRFTHLAMNGLDVVEGTRGMRIEASLFRDIGGNGILLGSFQTGPIETHLPYDPADEREVCRESRIANNLVTDCANEDWGCVGIGVGYARDTVIEHNEVSDVSYTAISVGWGWTRTLNAMRNNRVHANHLHHYATRMCDTAGVYTLSAQPGTIVSENVVHSVTMTPYVDRPEHWFYLYLDEGSSYIQVRDNWTPEERFFENAVGPGNVWTNNGPKVDAAIVARAGLPPDVRAALGGSDPSVVLQAAGLPE